MLKKIMTMLLVVLIVNLAVIPSVFANDSKLEKEAKFIEKVRINIQKLGTGPDAQVEVKLKDNTKTKGYVSEANDEQFTVVDKNTGQSTSIPYPQVKQIKGNNLSGRVIFAIGFAALIVILVILLRSDKS
jgi:preprotein translocase subunit SecF